MLPQQLTFTLPGDIQAGVVLVVSLSLMFTEFVIQWLRTASQKHPSLLKL